MARPRTSALLCSVCSFSGPVVLLHVPVSSFSSERSPNKFWIISVSFFLEHKITFFSDCIRQVHFFLLSLASLVCLVHICLGSLKGGRLCYHQMCCHIFHLKLRGANQGNPIFMIWTSRYEKTCVDILRHWQLWNGSRWKREMVLIPSCKIIRGRSKH